VSDDPRQRVFVALDLPSLAEAVALADRLGDDAPRVKVGLELFAAAGPEAVRAFAGREVFLDLKLHDIPETVRRAAEAAAAHGARWLTVHAAGGRAMLEAAVAGAGARCGILAVTVLTSLEAADLAADGHPLDPAALCVRRAELAITAGCAGVIASPREAAAIRAAVGPAALIVTPGVRPVGAATGDQKRVDTPRAAIAAGASAVVVGRPIRDAPDPRAALRAIIRELG
jgi:orotidine-5'-phosphate decarboxylase